MEVIYEEMDINEFHNQLFRSNEKDSNFIILVDYNTNANIINIGNTIFLDKYKDISIFFEEFTTFEVSSESIHSSTFIDHSKSILNMVFTYIFRYLQYTQLYYALISTYIINIYKL